MTRQAVPTVTPGAAASTPPSETGSSEPSLLETLRRSIQEDATPRNDASTRLASFGRGVLSGRGSFLDNLSAGLASQETADATRREEMRKASEAQMRLVEADRKAMLDKAKFGAEAPWRESQANLANAQADYYRRRASEPGAAGRPLSQRDLANYRLRAEVEARNQVAARYRNAIIPPPPEQIQTEINAAIPQILERILATEGMTPSAAPAAPQQPAIPTLNPAGRPTQ
jgi:hypothetical protein